MALVYIDSFQHENPTRYTSTGGAWAFGTTAKTGSRSYNFAATGGQTTTLTFQPAPTGSTYHVGFQFYSSGTTNYPKISLMNDAVSASHLDIEFTTSGGKVQALMKSGSDGSTLLTASQTINTGFWFHVSFTVTIHNSNGAGTLYINEVEEGSFSGADTRNGGSSDTAGGIMFTGTGTTNHYLDDLYVLDNTGSKNNTWPGEMSVQWLFPGGAGSSAQWAVFPSGANYAAVDEAGTAGTDYVYSAVAGNTDLYVATDMVGTIYRVDGVQICAGALKSDSGASNIALLSRANAVTTEGPSIPLTTSIANYYLVREEASSGTPWTSALVNSMEIGARVK